MLCFSLDVCKVSLIAEKKCIRPHKYSHDSSQSFCRTILLHRCPHNLRIGNPKNSAVQGVFDEAHPEMRDGRKVRSTCYSSDNPLASRRVVMHPCVYANLIPFLKVEVPERYRILQWQFLGDCVPFRVFFAGHQVSPPPVDPGCRDCLA